MAATKLSIIPPDAAVVRAFRGRHYTEDAARLYAVRRSLVNRDDRAVPVGITLYDRHGKPTRRLTTCGAGNWHEDAKGGAA